MNIIAPHNSAFGDASIAIEYSAEVPYTALWYENTTAYRGVNATFPMYQQPMGIHAASVGKTFLCWANGQSPCWATIVVFNHGTGQFEGVKKIFQMADQDGHRTPALHIDGSGYLYIFAGSHGDATQVWKSNAPYATANWTQMASIAGATTYPQPHAIAAPAIDVFLRKGDAWGFVRSSDGFASVGSFAPILVSSDPSTEWVYALTRSEDGIAHLIWTTYVPATQTRKHIWYATSNGGQVWKTAAGSTYGLPIVAQNGEKIFDSGTSQVNLQDLQIAPNGDPVAMFSVGSASSWAWKIARYNGATWDISTIPAMADRQFDCGGLLIVAADDFRAILPSAPGQAGEDGGNIEEWRSDDGGQTWALFCVHTSDPYNHNNVKVVRNSHADCRAFWSYGDATVNGPGHLRFLADSKGAEAIRPGNPYKRIVSITLNGVELASEVEISAPPNGLRVEIDQSQFSVRTSCA